ncbi:hypothetical protein IE53DRAFT_45396 [Violaceomyces palustris]|uniref:Uncharacterized protein n=1 Tax=Violaceomyces palustris TaxID=1673888 RepID=A0ACD0P0P7_9BASI|nr:hypothetical protein IE53DRAFT_45396 [Violaceomyces palustris]
MSGPTSGSQRPEDRLPTKGSFNVRESRVVSIYDKYLYDPKDLESSDPRRRELARKASNLKLQGGRPNLNEANGQPRRTMQRKSSLTWAKGTKGGDEDEQLGLPISESKRESGAWGLGLGMLGGSSSDSESESDEDQDRNDNNVRARGPSPRSRPPQPQPQPGQPQNKQLMGLKSQFLESSKHESWSTRAAAVGQRPPDNASQNPPSLKMLGLKSSKMAGSVAPPPPASTFANAYADLREEHQRSRIVSTSEYGDDSSRHGSAIGFAGQDYSVMDDGGATRASSTFSPETKPNRMIGNPSGAPARPISPRTALTKQLGLASPDPPQDVGKGESEGRNASSPGNDYFSQGNAAFLASSSAAPSSRSLTSSNSSGSLTVPSASPGFGPSSAPTSGPSPVPLQRSPSPHGPMATMPDAAAQAAARPQNQYNALHSPRSPSRPMAPQGSMASRHGDGPSPPRPALTNPRSDLNGRMLEGGPRVGPGGVQAGHPQGLMPGGGGGVHPRAGPQVGPSFSEVQGPAKRQSIFRRSMNLFAASGGPPPPGGPQQPPQGRRQSMFRRSMAFFMGGGANTGERLLGPPVMPTPAPEPGPVRVKGFTDDSEKLDHSRKSRYLGAGGDGFEWDVTGQGANFWKRFSRAQRQANDAAVQEASKEWHERMRKGSRKLAWMAAIGLVLVVGLIVGVILWRERVSPSSSSDSLPGSVNKANFGGTSVGAGETLSWTPATSATSTSLGKRWEATPTPISPLPLSSPFGRPIHPHTPFHLKGDHSLSLTHLTALFPQSSLCFL